MLIFRPSLLHHVGVQLLLEEQQILHFCPRDTENISNTTAEIFHTISLSWTARNKVENRQYGPLNHKRIPVTARPQGHPVG